MQEWDKLYSINKKYLDPVAPRFSAIMKDSAELVTITNLPDEVVTKLVPLHPKNDDIGNKICLFSNKIYVERDDIASLAVNEKITLMKWGNATVKTLNPCTVELDLNDKDFKSTKKINWLAAVDNLLEVEIIEYDHLLTRADAVDYEGEFMDIVNKNSKMVSVALVEPALRALKKGDHLQIERRGFYIVDHVGCSNLNKYKLIFIPDGKSKNMSTLNSKLDVKAFVKGDDNKKKEKMKKEEGAEDKKEKKEKKKEAKEEGLKKGKNEEFKVPKTDEDFSKLNAALEEKI